MKPLNYSILILLFAISQSAQAQLPGEELIPWRADRKLAWSDYKGQPDPASDAAASTASYLGIEYHFSNNKITFTITCSFSQTKSWGRYQTDYILSHEQGHFDITEIFARRLNQKMQEYIFNKNSFKSDLKKIYDDTMEEKEKMQNRYDQETDFSRNKEQQQEWLKKIEKMLAETALYASYG